MVTLLGSGCNAVVWWCADSLSPEEGSSLETSWGKIPPTFSQKWRCLQFSPKWKKTKSETTFLQVWHMVMMQEIQFTRGFFISAQEWKCLWNLHLLNHRTDWTGSECHKHCCFSTEETTKRGTLLVALPRVYAPHNVIFPHVGVHS